MKKILTLLFAFTICFVCNAQERVKYFQFSGYKAVFIPSDTFLIKIGHPELGNAKTHGQTFTLTIKDPEGKMPKDTVLIYTDRVRGINLNFSELIMDKQIVSDSLSISMASSHGSIHVKANYLKVSAKAGSNIDVKGQANYFEYYTKAYSSINTDQLQTVHTQRKKTE